MPKTIDAANLTELDKFKRRMIRSVARLLLHEKRPEVEVWEEMKKETSCDCQLLWQRMRVLTMKKLKRLLAAEDRSDSIPAIAKMSLTDWLLFDLVLVHEKVDVIGREKIAPDKADCKSLTELFTLVQRFNIEGLRGDSLAEAWTAATVLYNVQYPTLITSPFLKWEDMIREKLIIMPEEFEEKMRMKNLPKPCDENAPDLVLVEPVIETIDLGQDSDSDYQDDGIQVADTENKQTNDIQIKDEPVESETNDIYEESNEVLERITIPQQAMTSVEVEETLLDSDNLDADADVDESITEENNITNYINSDETQEVETTSEVTESEVNLTNHEEVIPKITNIFGNMDITHETLSQISSLTQAQMMPQSNTDTVVENTDLVAIGIDDDLIEINKENGQEKTLPIDEDHNSEATIDPVVAAIENEIAMKAKSYREQTRTKVDNIALTNDIPIDLNFDDEEIEFADDGIVYIDEDEQLENYTNNVSPDLEVKTKIKDELGEQDESSEDNEETPKFDLKLLMNPLVYTRKLDDMNALKNIPFHSVSNKNLIDCINVESKPVSKKAVIVGDIKEEKDNSIMCDDRRIHDDLFKRDTSNDESEEEIDDSRRVKLSSYLLQKPRSRSYNSIQLCKNPDFNTRLKRLPVSFFSSSRNRFLLKGCKPMTIDVTKAFESKLLNGTIYLKGSDNPVVVVDDEDHESKVASVLPSAMAVQSLIDNTKLKDVLVSPPNRYTAMYPRPNVSPSNDVLERNKVINLPDIMQVRRINQRLLTAEVPPIRVESSNDICKTPEQVNEIPVPTPKTEPNVENQLNTLDIEKDSALITYTNDANTKNLDLDNKHDRSLLNQPAEKCVASEETDNSLLIHIADTPTISKEKAAHAIFESRRITPPLISESANDPCHQTNSNLVENIDRVTDTIANPTNKTSRQFENTNVANITNDGRKDKGSSYVPKYKQVMWRPLTDGKNATVSWLTKPKYVETAKIEDSLLTLDTLNKMLMLLSGTNPDDLKSDKTKKKEEKKAKLRAEQKTIEKSKVQPDTKVTDGNETKTTKKKKGARPKINIVYSQKSNHLFKGKHCCWARERIVNNKTGSKKRTNKHMCPVNDCICCCKEAYLRSTSIVLSDDEDDQLKNACDSIESVIQQTRAIVSSENGIARKVTSICKRYPNKNVARRSIGTDPMEPTNLNWTQESNDISRTVVTISTNVPHLYHLRTRTSKEAGSMVDMSNQSPIITVPQTESEISISNTIKSNLTPIIPVASPIPDNLEVHDVDTRWTYTSHCSNIRREIVPPRIPSPNVTLARPKRQLVIDCETVRTGQEYPHIKINTKEKVLYINRNRISKMPSTSPIYLGKNKILLTNVILPLEIASGSIPKVTPKIVPKVIPTLPLPNGVQLVLLPDGGVTFTVDPKMQIDPEQLSILPQIIDAVQQQLASDSSPVATTAPAPCVNEINNIAGDGISASTDKTFNGSLSANSIAEHNTDVRVITIDASNLDNNKEIVNNVTNNASENMEAKSQDNLEQSPRAAKVVDQQKTIEVSIAQNLNLENVEGGITSIIDLETSNKKTDESTKSKSDNDKSTCNTNRKSLLSDLMELSGISAEDTTPLPSDSLPQELNNTAIPIPDLVPIQNNNLSIVNPYFPNLPELYPIKSFTELKYACDNNGLFFKLDFETGVIVPINVCIKKNPKNIKRKHRCGDNDAPKAVIDLTDDMDISPEDKITEENESVTVTKRPAINTNNSVKPLKIFRAMHYRNLLQRSSKATYVVRHLNINQNNSDITFKVRKRKQDLSKIEANIDLVDSDNPIEEEYLVDSSGSDVDHEQLDDNLSDDSSDDEPLIKKAKRMREIEEKTMVTKLDKNCEATEGVQELDQITVESEGTLAESEKPDDVLTNEAPISDDFDNDEPPELSFMYSDENDEEDCILGV